MDHPVSEVRLTEQEIDEARLAFLKFDADQSGSIDQVNFILFFGTTDLSAFSFSSFLLLFIFYSTRGCAEPKMPNSFFSFFLQFELKKVLEHMNVKVSDSDVFQMISEVDEDNSGAIGKP